MTTFKPYPWTQADPEEMTEAAILAVYERPEGHLPAEEPLAEEPTPESEPAPVIRRFWAFEIGGE